MQRIWIPLIVVLALSWAPGCSKKEEQAAPTPSPTPQDTVTQTEDVEAKAEPTPEPEAVPEKTEEEIRIEQLENSFLRLYCLRKSGAKEDMNPIYTEFGHKDAASWSRAWAAEAEKNPEWARSIVQKAAGKACDVAPQ